MNIALEKLDKQFDNQQAIANAFGVSQSAISQWFGRNSVPQNRLIDVAEITGIPVEVIVKANLSRKND
ncbi:MAG: Cro/CI family transcriptional regulator [Methylobacter sp.]